MSHIYARKGEKKLKSLLKNIFNIYLEILALERLIHKQVMEFLEKHRILYKVSIRVSKISLHLPLHDLFS